MPHSLGMYQEVASTPTHTIHANITVSVESDGSLQTGIQDVHRSSVQKSSVRTQWGDLGLTLAEIKEVGQTYSTHWE